MTTQHALELVLVRADNGAVELVDPDSGETVPLAEADAQLLARVLRNVEIDLTTLRDARRWLAREMIVRMDRSTTWTIRARGVEVTAPSAAPKVEWDATILVPILDDLVREGVIDREASLRACAPRTEWKPLARGINAILKLPGTPERLAPARRTVDAARSVQVNINPGGK